MGTSKKFGKWIRNTCMLMAFAGTVANAHGQALPDFGGRKIVAITENSFPPLDSLDPKTGKGVGWEYDAVNEIGRRLNLKIEWRISSWDAMIQSVRDGQADIAMNGITINDERKAQVDFSAPYMTAQLFMMVRANESRFHDAAGFRANRNLLAGAQPGTTSFYSTAKDLLGVTGASPRIKLFDTFGATAQALRAGDIDVVLSDATAAGGYIKQYPNTYKVVGSPLQGENYGFIFKKGSPLVPAVNAALAAMQRDGTIQRLNQKWLPPASAIAK
ncbi:MAG: transporter substrate-binding domain-containing protein [Burkholderiaceae bacterium]|nr:transporter substrate-binding domain-containing protein [Burkholderiaceae bacterium]